MNPTIELSETVRPEDYDVIRQGLIAFNLNYLGPADFRRLGVFSRVDGQVVGGLVAETLRGILRIDLLWVAEERRKEGLGSRLLTAAEDEARRRACTTAFVDTFDFQARPFYERHGYRVFGELGGHPNGHKTFFLSKTL